MANFLIPRRQSRSEGVGHTAAPSWCNSCWRQSTAMRPCITASTNLRATPVADLAPVHFLESANTAGLLDIAEHSCATGLDRWRGRPG